MTTAQGKHATGVRSRTLSEVLLVEEHPERAAELRAMLERDPSRDWRIAESLRPEHVRPMLTRERAFVVALPLEGDEAEAVRRVRVLQVPGRTVPVVAVVAELATGLRAVAEGADEFVLIDPLDPEASSAALSRALGRQVDTLVERAERRALRSLIDRAGDALVVLDPNLAMVHVNPEAERLFGRLSGRAIEQVLAHARDAQPEGEVEVDRADGPVCRLRWRLVEGHWDGGPARFVLLRDLTTDVAAYLLQERLAHTERLAAIGTMAAGVAHEINNPLATVIGSRDLAERVLDQAAEEDDPAGSISETREMLQDMREGLERIRLVVRDLAQFSRGDHAHAEAVDLDEVVRATCHLIGNQLRHRARLQVELGGVPTVPGVRVKVAQVVTNLLLNAIQALDEGRSSANRILVRTWSDAERVHLLVEDTGCGIPADVRERIFEPFFTTKADRQGTGLGLALSSQIVGAHGGCIRFESTVGVGTRFIVDLPFGGAATVPAPTVDAPACESGRPQDPRPVVRPRVLAVDDEPGILELLELAFVDDYEMVAAASGPEALRLLERGDEFDVVLCDLMMPDVDGIALYEYLRRARPELAERTIFLSGGAFSERAQRFLSDGRHRLIEKPFRFEQIGAEIEDLLQGPPAR